jgi:hypothetical protein
VGNFSELSEQVVEFAVAEQEGISATQQHVPYFGVLAYVVESLLVTGMKIVVLGVRNQAASGAIAAIGGTAVGYEK